MPDCSPCANRVVLIDNYDSFTYNLVHYLQELDQKVAVFQNDKITVAEIAAAQPRHIVISPGPGRPEQAGVTIPLIQALYQKIPILGVCLGHQAIAAAFDGKIISAPQIMHGKTSSVEHAGQGIFLKMPSPFTAMRYHSLVIDSTSLPADFLVTAWTQQADIMAIQHRHFPLVGVQFHPESIATVGGHQLLANFLKWSAPIPQTYLPAHNVQSCSQLLT